MHVPCLHGELVHSFISEKIHILTQTKNDTVHLRQTLSDTDSSLGDPWIYQILKVR